MHLVTRYISFCLETFNNMFNLDENPLCGGMICSESALDTDLCQCPPSNNTKLKQTTTDNNPETSTLPNAQTTQSAQSTPAEQTTSQEQVHTTEDTGFLLFSSQDILHSP